MIDHLIYDFDGTIADSYPLFLNMWLTVAKKFNLTLPCSEDELYRALKNTGYDAYLALDCADKVDYDTFLHEFHALQKAQRMDFKPYPQAIKLLRDAKRAGKKNYLYTHTGPVVKDMLANMGILDCFEFILDSSYGFPLKPAPDALLFLLEHCGLDPATCIMIGDRPIDAHAGQNAGITGCLWDGEDLFSPEGVDYYIKDLGEVADIVGF
ncbi:MAG: HAD-IA family hydrolase [Clostridia bacterium]|nr:HAD-IA family hydrolase [Clostridia bacterium]